MSARAAVIGIGFSKLYRRAEVPLGKLAVDAALAAIADAGLRPGDIDGVATAPVHPAALPQAVDGVSFVGVDFMIKALKLDPAWNDEGTFLVMQSFESAVHAVAAGTCTHALVFRALHNPSGRYGRMDIRTAYGPDQWYSTYGSSGSTAIAQSFHRYMHDFGGTKEMLGEFVLRNRRVGLKNPISWWRNNRPGELTMDEYLNDRIVSYPLGVLDCDLPIQGAGAVVITSAERARDLVAAPAYVTAMSYSPEFFSWVGYPDTWESNVEAGRRMGDHLWLNSGVGPADIDVANLYDGFSCNVAFMADSMRLSEPGQGLQWIAHPSIPLNTSGGNLGNGRLHGVIHLADGAEQVMGRAGERQVDGARLSLVTVGGTHHAGAVIFSDDPDI